MAGMSKGYQFSGEKGRKGGREGGRKGELEAEREGRIKYCKVKWA